MSLTFKQYAAYLDAPLTEDDHLNEMWPFSNKEEAAKARRKKLQLLAKKGDLKAKKELDDIDHAERVITSRKEREKEMADRKFNAARDSAEVADRSSSRNYDRETGSINRRLHDPIWGHEGKTRA